MINHEQASEKKHEVIKWPRGSVVEVGSNVDFVYIMRKDGKFAISPIAKRMATDNQLDEQALTQTLLEEYDTFFTQLVDIFTWGFSAKSNFELHLFDPDEMDESVRSKSVGIPIISLDPLMNEGVLEHKVSRGYYLGGRKEFGQVARPVNPALSLQALEIAAKLNGLPASVAEDDIFSGGSVIASLTELLNQGVNIQKVIPGIQVGKPEKLSAMGLNVDPVVEYRTTDKSDIFDKVDLGDPRDYLLGASGLVVQLPNGELGRAPYVLPFVSTSARASMPAEAEKDFGIKVLQANLEFFNAVEEKVGTPLFLKYTDQSFQVLMHQMYGVDHNAEMGQIATWLMENIDDFWAITKKQGEFQEKLAKLKLPHNLVFLDVNGTLFPDDSTDGYIPAEDILSFKQTVARVKGKGLSVGLCSDSPLPQLQTMAEKLGIDGPILAENGNILSYTDQTFVLNALSDIEVFKEHISSVAAKTGFQQADDCVAPEFGGNSVDVENFQWAFGANRKTSVTVFGPSQLIQHLGSGFSDPRQDFSIDCSPEYNYFAIHPGKNYKLNKGKSLNTLVAYNHNVVMVGNSMSDWVEPNRGVLCTFVGGARINPNAADKAGYISEKPVIKGVIDILGKIK